ncbi:T6SS immunity protein Tli4 family protein [Duganella callida]|uniref:Tle cognate immunity protein 4 C-terminal domain-containing protein n=1 Tax=Duganella callida TaxID=2561932 RepID=A0A4Y9RWH1_9BURK|nr:T6SS immunity protein Tli4 family protein [Duganella callida]TFW13637.1 hypothetical protein E4L98_28745 [Duganella callida]
MKLICGLLFALLLTGCDDKKNDLTIQNKVNISVKSHCIGHSTIDLPDGYALKSGASAIFTHDQDEVEDGNIDVVEKTGISGGEFRKLVAARHAELADDEGMTSKLSEVRDLPNEAKLMRVHVIDDAYKSEIHWLLDDIYLVASVSSYKNQVAKSEALLLDLMRNVQAWKNPIEKAAAFCMGDVAVKGKYRSESASFHFVSPQTPDIAFSVDVDTYEKDDAVSLHQRLEGPNSLLKALPVKQSVLRKAEINVAGMRAQEWATSLSPGEKGDKDLAFFLETVRPVPSPATPKIHLEMEVTGASAANEAGALALWDKVSRSIR